MNGSSTNTYGIELDRKILGKGKMLCKAMRILKGNVYIIS